jgi:hypothetical protein
MLKTFLKLLFLIVTLKQSALVKSYTPPSDSSSSRQPCEVTECRTNEIFDYLNCKCTYDYCTPQPCPRGYHWGRRFGGCECFLSCTIYKKCPKDEIWDYIECKCIEDPSKPSPDPPGCKWKNCKRGYRLDLRMCRCELYPEDPNVCNLSCSPNEIANYNTCECDPTTPPSPSPSNSCISTPCPPGYVRNEYGTGEYKCECVLSCDFRRTCPPGEMWSSIKCRCVLQPSRPSLIPSSSVMSLSSSSSAQGTACYYVSCQRGYIQKPSTCECVPISPSTQCLIYCPSGFTPNIDLCRCDPTSLSSSEVSDPSSSDPPFCGYQECPSGYKYGYYRPQGQCQCYPICEYSLSCPTDQEWDIETCQCVSHFTPSSSPSCEPQTCPRGYIWGLWGGCQCYLACDYIMSCPPGEEWDFIECGCFKGSSVSSPEPCTPATCEKGFIFDELICECVEDPTPTCDYGFVYDVESCKCICENCTECQQNFIFDENTCTCVCPEGQLCDEGFVFDSEICGCVCEKQVSCEEGFVFDNSTCSCACLPEEDCIDGKIWDENICTCVTNHTPQCSDGFVYDPELCDCVCQAELECEYPKIFDKLTCACECLDASSCKGSYDYFRCKCIERAPSPIG